MNEPVTLNRMCSSSHQAVHFVSQAIAAGDVGYAIGSGVESMTRVHMFSNNGDDFAGLEATDGQFGLQVMCAAHGMATATILERP